MKCFNDFLNTPIGAGCSEIVGLKANGVLYPRTGIASYTITDAVATFTLKEGVEGVPVFMPAELPYKPAVTGEKNEYGLTKFTKTVEFFFVENAPLSQEQILSLQNDGYVLVALDNNGRSIVFGLEAGLRFVSSSQDFNSVETHGGIVVEMQEANANYPMLFTTAQAIVPLLGIEYLGESFGGVSTDTYEWLDDITFTPSNATNKTLIFISSDESVATVSSGGLITIISTSEATCTITATAVDGGWATSIEVAAIGG